MDYLENLDALLDQSISDEETFGAASLDEDVKWAILQGRNKFYEAFTQRTGNLATQVTEEADAEKLKRDLLQMKWEARAEARLVCREKLKGVAFEIAIDLVQAGAGVQQILEVLKLDEWGQVNDLTILACNHWTDDAKVVDLIQNLMERRAVDYLFITMCELEFRRENIPALIAKIREKYPKL